MSDPHGVAKCPLCAEFEVGNTGSDEYLWVNGHAQTGCTPSAASSAFERIPCSALQLSAWDPHHPPVLAPPPARVSLCTQPSDSSSQCTSPGERTRSGQEGGSWALE